MDGPPHSSSLIGLSALRSVEVLEPGLVVIRNALSSDAQSRVAALAMARGREAERGFWKSNGELNCSAACHRGRVFDAIGAFDDCLSELCTEAVQHACMLDPQMPSMSPTHLLLVYYASGRGIFWHKDDAPNDGQNDHPVVSFSLGNTCTFGVCHKWSWQRGKEHSRFVELHSGDAILFGGPCRYIHHAVTGVKRGTVPVELRALLGDARLNLTFRDAPAVLGLEQTTYKYFEPPKAAKSHRAPKRAASGQAGGGAAGIGDDGPVVKSSKTAPSVSQPTGVSPCTTDSGKGE